MKRNNAPWNKLTGRFRYKSKKHKVGEASAPAEGRVQSEPKIVDLQSEPENAPIPPVNTQPGIEMFSGYMPPYLHMSNVVHVIHHFPQVPFGSASFPVNSPYLFMPQPANVHPGIGMFGYTPAKITPGIELPSVAVVESNPTINQLAANEEQSKAATQSNNDELNDFFNSVLNSGFVEPGIALADIEPDAPADSNADVVSTSAPVKSNTDSDSSYVAEAPDSESERSSFSPL